METKQTILNELHQIEQRGAAEIAALEAEITQIRNKIMKIQRIMDEHREIAQAKIAHIESNNQIQEERKADTSNNSSNIEGNDESSSDSNEDSIIRFSQIWSDYSNDENDISKSKQNYILHDLDTDDKIRWSQIESLNSITMSNSQESQSIMVLNSSLFESDSEEEADSQPQIQNNDQNLSDLSISPVSEEQGPQNQQIQQQQSFDWAEVLDES